jgi:serine/threonine protein kinase
MSVVYRSVADYDMVRELLPRGGMGSVFLATDRRDGREVALKLVALHDDPDACAAERAGAQLQAQISAVCPMVPAIYEQGTADPYFFIAMEYVDGETLSSLIARGALLPERAAQIAADLCSFLETAHAFQTDIDGRTSRAVIHCDLKPRNVRIAANGDTRVLDFGIAKALALSRKVTRNEFGSTPYFSPERLDSNDVDAHTDLWALGVIFYEMLGGALPFTAADTDRCERQVRLGYAAQPLDDGCPIGLRAIVARLLTFAPSRPVSRPRPKRTAGQRARRISQPGGRRAPTIRTPRGEHTNRVWRRRPTRRGPRGTRPPRSLPRRRH